MSVLEVIENAVERIKTDELRRRMNAKERALIDATGLIESADHAAKNSEAIKQLLASQEQVERDSIENTMQLTLGNMVASAFKAQVSINHNRFM